jgi:hypothetical protein
VVTKWLHVETTVIDPWVLPIWNAVHRAVQEGRTTRPGHAAGQLALHLSTRLAMLPVIFRRLNEGMEQLKAVLAGRESFHEWTTEREGYVFPIPQDLQYGLLVDLDALLFELKACGELFLNFFALLHHHAGKPIQKKKLWLEFTKVIEEAKQDTSWLVHLKDYRGFFIHHGTPYFAVDLSNAPEWYDLLIMKENLRAFEDETKFVRLSELRDMVEGFAHSKRVLQEYLIHLFSA